MKKKVALPTIVFILPELLFLSISIILITMGSINYPIAPAPSDLKDITQYTGSTFCIPVSKIENGVQYNDDDIKASMNHAYQLMLTTVILGVVSFVLSLYLLLCKLYR